MKKEWEVDKEFFRYLFWTYQVITIAVLFEGIITTPAKSGLTEQQAISGVLVVLPWALIATLIVGVIIATMVEELAKYIKAITAGDHHMPIRRVTKPLTTDLRKITK
jgi:hypothetical protein